MSDDSYPLPPAVLFDMDGTLTCPMLNFPIIKREMGIPPDQPILEALAAMDAQSRPVAEKVLHRHEMDAAKNSRLNPGCRQLLRWLDQNTIKVAVITRNSRENATSVFRRHRLNFEVLVTRELGRFKPDPHPLQVACEQLRVTPGDCWMIGDGRYDIEAGLAAGARAVWISHGRIRDFTASPWRTVGDLLELRQLLMRARPRSADRSPSPHTSPRR